MYNDNRKQFLKQLQSLSHSRSPHRVFSDWLEIASLTLHQMPYQSGDFPKDAAFETIEQCYLKRIQPYSRDELSVFAVAAEPDAGRTSRWLWRLPGRDCWRSRAFE